MKKDFYIASDVDPDKVQDEYYISTLGLIVWLCVWSFSRQTGADKERARAMQEALFAALLHPQTWFYDSLAARHTAALAECEFQTTSGQPCRCVKYLMKDISNELADWRWSHFQTFLVDILFDNSCASYCALANRLPKEIAFYCDCGILAREEADPLKSARQFNGPGGKRRRIDPEFKDAIVKLSVSDATKPNTAASFTGTCSAKTATDCIVKGLKSSKLACQNQMRCTGAVCMADDSSGHGKPSESTLMSIIFDGNAKLTAVGQPVVFNPHHDSCTHRVPDCVATPNK